MLGKCKHLHLCMQRMDNFRQVVFFNSKLDLNPTVTYCFIHTVLVNPKPSLFPNGLYSKNCGFCPNYLYLTMFKKRSTFCYPPLQKFILLDNGSIVSAIIWATWDWIKPPQGHRNPSFLMGTSRDDESLSESPLGCAMPSLGALPMPVCTMIRP